MNRDIQHFKKEMKNTMVKQREELLSRYAKKILENTDADRHIKNGKLNINSLVSKIRSELNKVTTSVNKIK